MANGALIAQFNMVDSAWRLEAIFNTAPKIPKIDYKTPSATYLPLAHLQEKRRFHCFCERLLY